ncbi:imidazole-4-carboxamide isomerase HIS6 [Sugiyamaella lignohabitans]|uniref:1-(5-phosphoribosyl)-5-[(5-phosphoribosylamino)methylideneamino] imidazole-4-carboxamide isomerase n=1 Tax=Sugiyamaella lignohabitans TaxID=796027 RepID=A0A167EXU4_9ASCO|nr:imidazole-4-carboxamide isomerase HIS6 [Sugiyamaella lignohabitans]ANB14586.1 imidazole-4-carboxamide isomerase HIS6 [Sugiyamaella lignohabitans]
MLDSSAARGATGSGAEPQPPEAETPLPAAGLILSFRICTRYMQHEETEDRVISRVIKYQIRRAMTKFRGCIDIHNGQVKQIVGGTLTSAESQLKTNFVATQPAEYFGRLYRKNEVYGTHVIKLGPGCDEAAEEALAEWPGQLQVGGGITAENAQSWIQEKKASKVIVTSYLFPDGKLSIPRLEKLVSLVGKEHLVIDLSCRKKIVDGEPRWIVAMNRWQTLTDTEVNKSTLDELSRYCSEFLIHAADVEGLCRGIDEDLVAALGNWVTIPTVYAGGAKSLNDLELVAKLSHGKVDLTFGSALDIFGGDKVAFSSCVAWNQSQSQ